MEPINPKIPSTTTTNQTSQNTQRRPTKIGGATLASAACAACKYQRKKCSSDCLLAPYFPPNHQTQFLNVHKLFGVSNILKTIRNLNDPLQKEEAIRSMIIQAEIRANDPVGGCYKLFCDLRRKIEQHEAELTFVLDQLNIYRAKSVSVGGSYHEMMNMNLSIHGSSSLNVYTPINHSYLLQPIQEDQQQQQLQDYNNIIQENQGVLHNGDDDLVLNQLWNMETLGNHDGEINMVMNPLSSLMNDKQEQEQEQEQQEPVVETN